MNNTDRAAEIAPFEAALALPEEPSEPMCVTCGERPWGFGYCGEECKACAAS